MRFVVYSNFDRDNDIEVVDKVIKVLEKKKDVSFALASYRESGLFGHSFLKLSDCLDNTDAVIVVGGDGTVLRAIGEITSSGKETPVLAINRGVVGFLADTEPQEFESVIEKVISGVYDIEKRTVLKATYLDKTFFALNETVIYKKDVTRPIVVDIFRDGDIAIGATQADGAYIATPTGSTAYSLSAGGPVLSPDAEALVLNAICAHTLVSKPLVVSDKHKFAMRLNKRSDEAHLMIDGEIKAVLNDSSPVYIEKADITANFIKTKDYDFYQKLVEKLNRWTKNVFFSDNGKKEEENY